VDDLPVDPDAVAAARGRPLDRRVVAAVALGALPGAAARHALAEAITAPAGHFPWATFSTNVSGSLALGLVLAVLLQRYPPATYARAFAGTGFLGAFTTFSTFSVEADVLIKDGHAAMALAYVVASLTAGLGAAGLGLAAGGRLTGRRPR